MDVDKAAKMMKMVELKDTNPFHAEFWTDTVPDFLHQYFNRALDPFLKTWHVIIELKDLVLKKDRNMEECKRMWMLVYKSVELTLSSFNMVKKGINSVVTFFAGDDNTKSGKRL